MASTSLQGQVQDTLGVFNCYTTYITSTFVAKKMYEVILDKIDFEPKLIIRDIDDRFQYKISYAKAWRAKQKVFEMRFGHIRHHMVICLTCCQQLCREILKARLIPTLYRVYMGDQGFCFVLSSALVHVFQNITEKKPLCSLGAMRYMAWAVWDHSLHQISLQCTFPIQMLGEG